MLRVRRTSDRVFTLPKAKAASDSLSGAGAPKSPAPSRPTLTPKDTTRRVPPIVADSVKRPPRVRE